MLTLTMSGCRIESTVPAKPPPRIPRADISHEYQGTRRGFGDGRDDRDRKSERYQIVNDRSRLDETLVRLIMRSMAAFPDKLPIAVVQVPRRFALPSRLYAGGGCRTVVRIALSHA